MLQEKHNFDLPAATLLNSLSCYSVHWFSLFSFASVFHRRPSLTGPSDGLTRRIPHPSQMVISIGPRTMGSCCFLLLGDSVYYFLSLFSLHLLLDSDSVFLPYFRISLYLSLPFLSPPLCPLSLFPLHYSPFLNFLRLLSLISPVPSLIWVLLSLISQALFLSLNSPSSIYLARFLKFSLSNSRHLPPPPSLSVALSSLFRSLSSLFVSHASSYRYFSLSFQSISATFFIQLSLFPVSVASSAISIRVLHLFPPFILPLSRSPPPSSLFRFCFLVPALFHLRLLSPYHYRCFIPIPFPSSSRRKRIGRIRCPVHSSCLK